jgi:Holliday junction resolvase
MANPSYSRRKGASFETAVLKLLRAKKFVAERLRLAGKDDEGDIVCMVAGRPFIFELKATAKMDLPQFWREATTEAFNYAKARGLDVAPPAYVIVKRRMASIEQAWVIQDLNQWISQAQSAE